MKKKKCHKKIVNKKYVEDKIVLKCRKLLTDNNIENIATSVATAYETD